MARPLSAVVAEPTTAAYLRDSVAPLLAEALTCALTDQPADPAGYCADFVAAHAPTAGAQRLLTQRALGQECSRLDEELGALQEQLAAARAELARRAPDGADLGAADLAAAAAGWHELRRLKRLTRSLKFKMGEPIASRDWAIPEGLLLIHGAAGTHARALCRQLARDFELGLVEAGDDDVALLAARTNLRARPEGTVLLEGLLDGGACVEQLAECARVVGRPSALLLLQCEPSRHAARVREEAATLAGAPRSEAELAAIAEASRKELDVIESAAQQASIPVHRVSVDGDFNEQMTALLVSVSSL
jgi:hypothetical protein